MDAMIPSTEVAWQLAMREQTVRDEMAADRDRWKRMYESEFAKRDELHARAAGLVAERDALRSRLAEAEAERNAANGRANGAETLISNQSVEIDQLHLRLAECQQERQRSERLVIAQLSRRDELEKALAAAEATIAAMRKQSLEGQKDG